MKKHSIISRFLKCISLIVICIYIISGNMFSVFKTVNADSYNPGVVAFVTSLYSDCLGRNPDSVGLSEWCAKLSNGTITGKQCAYGFFFSSEFNRRANMMDDSTLVDTYYRVFLNRPSDNDGSVYWIDQIRYDWNVDYYINDGCNNDISILFTGFADSAEFAEKCASYGIVAGPHINVPNTVRIEMDPYHASSPEILDEIWAVRGYEIYYIDLGNGSSQKCYAKFDDTTSHNNHVNAYRVQNGLYQFNMISDLNDERVQYARTRAVEVALLFGHVRPCTRELQNTSAGENSLGGRAFMAGSDVAIDIFRNSPGHNAAMLNPGTQDFTSASCIAVFVAPDQCSLFIDANECLRYWGLDQYGVGYGVATVQEFWL